MYSSGNVYPQKFFYPQLGRRVLGEQTREMFSPIFAMPRFAARYLPR